MAWRIAVAVAIIAASLASVLVVACSGPTCKAGTLSLDVALLDTAPLADTVTVSITDPGAEVMQSFPHTPDPTAPGVEHTNVVVTFPGGYPANMLVHLLVRATGGVTVLGAGTATIHLDQTCTEGAIAVRGGGTPADLGGTD
jgi:hypothetical protein